MTTTEHSLTLSRWHSVADRVRTAAEAKQNEALNTLGSTTLTTSPTQEQQAALKARGARALAQVDEAREALRVVGRIRQALAQANAEAGVTGLLAEAEAKRQEVRFLDGLIAIDLLTKVPLDRVHPELEVRAREPAHLGYGRGAAGVSVALVELTALDALREERAVLAAEVNAINDRINDLNRKTIKLPLPDGLAAAVGLTA